MKVLLSLLSLLLVGCASAETSVFSVLDREAERLTGFPEKIAAYRRVGWELDRRSITVHYRSREGIASAWITRIDFDPSRENPGDMIRPERILETLSKQDPGFRGLEKGVISYRDRNFPFLRYRWEGSEGSREGCIAGSAFAEDRSRPYVVLIRVSTSLEGANPQNLLQPLLEATLKNQGEKP